ncbi:YL1 nuclear protein-domain-containing protein [Boletus reticuloceps]|uniref:YL1 nuclear protein-domain-containing protein n=1 Tax=Boletus reticuloceps TaxID=495285 RepID=A0A8I2YFX6_9AGAM|nr:YL1 nuclear protein-domain-containing protein [Boletus reticuloceps]
MAEEAESLVLRRPKRSTAGNRMELALTELTLEEPQEGEEDLEFFVDKEEEDAFESDFASTDEEAVQEDVEEEDRAVREEERQERKTARARVEKATAAAHARQRVTFNPGATTSRPRTQKPKRRVSLGVVVNAETGEVIEGGAGTVGVKRKSQRRHTILNTSATVNRIKDAEEKRAAIPKKTKMATRLPTQDELIARALDTEEGNITEHRDYLRLEEEKRAKARVVKQAIEGPVLRWVSKKETVQVEVQLPSPPPPPPATATGTGANLYAAKYSFVYASGVGGGTVGSQAYSMPFYAYTPFVAQNGTSKPQQAVASTSVTVPTSLNGNSAVASAGTSTSLVAQSTSSLPSTSSSNIQGPTTLGATPAIATTSVPPTSSLQQQPESQPQPPASVQAQTSTPTPTQTQTPPVLFSYPPAPTVPLVAHRNEDVCKNYVIHELSQSIPSKPPWKDTMSAMFGNHVQWDEMKVFTSKGRPLARPVRMCHITGLPAKYCDPRTNAPFANVGAYEVLTKVIGRGYVWCSALGCYVGVNEASQKDRRSDEEAEKCWSAGAGAGVVDGVVGGQENDETEEPEERIAKRRRIEMTAG